jgi:lycopene beta-cyclase
MDFRVDQQGGTTFVYVMPFTETKALVEYTLFTETLLQPQQYDEALKNYISEYLKLKTIHCWKKSLALYP